MQTDSTRTTPSVSEQPYSLKDSQGGNRSQTEEFDYWIDDTEGEIPPNLTGTLFRNGPGLLDIYGTPIAHPFDGDGMVNAFAFSKGRAHYRNRFVRTEEYCKEREAGRMLYRGVFGTQKPGGWTANAFDLHKKNVANTNIVYWGVKLMALWEASHPHRLDPYTLETLGIETLDGTLHEDSPFAAHPMMDPGDESREPRLVTFSLQAGPLTTITVYKLDLDGKVVKQHDHRIPGFCFIHDFAITPNYCIFFQNPVTFNPLPYVFGFKGATEYITYHGDRPTKIWVISRHGDCDSLVLEADPCFVFHHANAYEQGDEIVVHSVCYKNFPDVDHTVSYQQTDFNSVPPGQLWRFHLNLPARTATREMVVSHSCEFPFIHPAHIGKPHRWVYLAAAHQAEGNAPQQALLKVNLETGEQEFWSAAPKGFTGEPVFVAKPNSTREDEGWVFDLVYNAARDRSDLVILDAENFSQGPIATLHLKHHVPYGLHGSFNDTLLPDLAW